MVRIKSDHAVVLAQVPLKAAGWLSCSYLKTKIKKEMN